MPIRKQDYHPFWKRISLEIREQAGWRCEWCNVPGGKVIQRFQNGSWVEIDEIQACTTCAIEKTEKMKWSRLKFHKLTKIILTVAHLDRDSTNNNRDNLAALCQKCHLRHDILQHMQNRLYGRYHRKEQQLKIEYAE